MATTGDGGLNLAVAQQLAELINTQIDKKWRRRRADDGDAEEHDQFNGEMKKISAVNEQIMQEDLVSLATKKTTKEANAREERNPGYRET